MFFWYFIYKQIYANNFYGKLPIRDKIKFKSWHFLMYYLQALPSQSTNSLLRSGIIHSV